MVRWGGRVEDEGEGEGEGERGRDDAGLVRAGLGAVAVASR